MSRVKNFFKISRNDIDVFNGIFMLLLLYSVIRRIVLGYTKEDWNIAEWLINYQGGFVRRGLTGQALFDLYNHFEISPYTVILLISGLAFVGLVVFFVINFRKRGLHLSILLYPFFLGGLIIDNIWVRKDVVIVLIFILLIYLATWNSASSKKTGAGILKLFALNMVFSLGLLIHEELGFLAFPILFLIFFNSQRERFSAIKSALLSILKLVPSLIVFFSVHLLQRYSDCLQFDLGLMEVGSFPFSRYECCTIRCNRCVVLVTAKGAFVNSRYDKEFRWGYLCSNCLGIDYCSNFLPVIPFKYLQR